MGTTLTNEEFAERYGYDVNELDEDFLYNALELMFDEYGDPYPEYYELPQEVMEAVWNFKKKLAEEEHRYDI